MPKVKGRSGNSAEPRSAALAACAASCAAAKAAKGSCSDVAAGDSGNSGQAQGKPGMSFDKGPKLVDTRSVGRSIRHFLRFQDFNFTAIRKAPGPLDSCREDVICMIKWNAEQTCADSGGVFSKLC